MKVCLARSAEEHTVSKRKAKDRKAGRHPVPVWRSRNVMSQLVGKLHVQKCSTPSQEQMQVMDVV